VLSAPLPWRPAGSNRRRRCRWKTRREDPSHHRPVAGHQMRRRNGRSITREGGTSCRSTN
jgi:hypothetical protein